LKYDRTHSAELSHWQQCTQTQQCALAGNTAHRMVLRASAWYISIVDSYLWNRAVYISTL